MRKNKKSLKPYLLLGLVTIFVLYLIINDDGLFEYYNQKSEINDINNQIQKTENKIEGHKKEIDSLKNDPVKIEEIARKKYHMKSKNEKLIKIKEQ